jgi:hypothetical protein
LLLSDRRRRLRRGSTGRHDRGHHDAPAVHPTTGDDEDSDSDSEGDSEPTPTTAGEGTEDSDASSSTGGPAPWVPIPARGGVEIDYVEANQGVGVKIGADGAGVGGADRNTYLLQNRLMLVRAFWKPLPGDWTPREIEGRLIVTYPDDTPEKVLKSKTLVEGEAFVGNLDRSFYWGLMADEVVPNIRYRVELWEVGPGVADELPEPATPAAACPSTGRAPTSASRPATRSSRSRSSRSTTTTAWAATPRPTCPRRRCSCSRTRCT